MNLFHAAVALSLCCTLAAPQGVLAASHAAERFACAAPPAPVASLSFGSRYVKGDTSHSVIDDESEADVNAQLRPVDKFVSDVSRMANQSLLLTNDKAGRAACVGTWLASWARAGALTGLDSLDAKISVSPRIAGIAIAYIQAKKAGSIAPADDSAIRAWLAERSDTVRNFFDHDAPPMTRRNNLGAWAALAIGAVGLALDRPADIQWAKTNWQAIVCAANPDGSLPLEMRRADRALSYQLHAIGPLVMVPVLLGSKDFNGFTACNGNLGKIVNFALAGVKDPAIVAAVAGKPQTFTTGAQKLSGLQMAWAEPFLAHEPDPALDAFVAPMRPLVHSQLGGNLTKLYQPGKA